jgi:hypothetical protein
MRRPVALHATIGERVFADVAPHASNGEWALLGSYPVARRATPDE